MYTSFCRINLLALLRSYNMRLLDARDGSPASPHMQRMTTEYALLDTWTRCNTSNSSVAPRRYAISGTTQSLSTVTPMLLEKYIPMTSPTPHPPTVSGVQRPHNGWCKRCGSTVRSTCAAAAARALLKVRYMDVVDETRTKNTSWHSDTCACKHFERWR